MASGELLSGRYELFEVIGSGGTGSVRRARDTVLDRVVAVKLLRPGQDEVLRERLRVEARLAGGLHHPGIAQVFDYGETDEDGEVTPYLVMQYVEGTSLWQLLRERGTLPPHEVMDLVAQVAAALEVAHEAGIVHRDLKPGNILVTPEGRAVLVDFGIARSLDTEPLTLTGTIVGTVDYISPEQSVGRSASARSDLYALGMVAYECLSGRKPFRRETQVATALAHLNDEVPVLGGEVPPGVRRLVRRLVAKKPEDRPQDAAEVAAAASVLARDPDDGAGADRWAARMPATATAALRRPFVRTRAGLVAVGTVVALVATVVFVAARPEVVRVPDLEGLAWSAAAARLADRGLEAERVWVDAADVERGKVLAQSPAAGAEAEDDTVVDVEVATGRVVLDAGSLVGRTYERAARRLVGLGLVPTRVDLEQADDPGRVVAVDPGGRLKLGSMVTVTVAVAPEPEPVTSGSSTAGSDLSAASGSSGGGSGGGKARAPRSGPKAGSPDKGNGKARGHAQGKANGKAKGKGKAKGRGNSNGKGKGKGRGRP